jgi:SOS response regulatory protein OraA/RecX
MTKQDIIDRLEREDGRAKLIEDLNRLKNHPFDCPEHRHVIADILLLDYIDDDAVTEAWASLDRGYSLD